MASKSITLTDLSAGTWVDHLEWTAESTGLKLGTQSNWSLIKRTLRGGLQDGVDEVEISNGRLSMSILPTRGMGLLKGFCDGLEVGWKSPVTHPVNPMFVNLVERGGLGWLAGFNELLCRCGLDSNGPPGLDVIVNNQGQKTTAELTLHGKIANLPAHTVTATVDEAAGGTISVTGVVDESMLFGPCLQLSSTVQTSAGSNKLKITDIVTNLKATPAEMELLYHVNFGRPFLEEQSQLVVPAREVAPRDARAMEDLDSYAVYAPPTEGYVEQCYWFELAGGKGDETVVLLRNAHGNLGVSLRFNRKQLPCFTVWKNTQAEADGYVTGLEPGTNYPNLKTVEREHGRVVVLKPKESYVATVELAVLTKPEEVLATEREIAAIQGDRKPTVHPQPHPRYLPKSS